MTRPVRLVLALLTALAIAVATVPAVTARGLPSRIDLPNGFRPEGITGFGARLFVGSLADGAIWRGSAISGEGSLLVEGTPGQAAVGIDLDWHGRLWVAGGPTGAVRVYSARTGELLASYQFTAGFLNDVIVTHRAAYITDSLTQQLLVVPLGRRGQLPDPADVEVLPLTGDLMYTTGFNVNGIDAFGPWLVVVQSNTGLLFRVDPRTGDTSTIETDGYLANGGDGLEIVGRRMWIVRNLTVDPRVDVLNLGWLLGSADLVGEIRSVDPGLDRPSTATLALGKLYAVNARFDTPPGPTVEYWITRLPTRPND